MIFFFIIRTKVPFKGWWVDALKASNPRNSKVICFATTTVTIIIVTVVIIVDLNFVLSIMCAVEYYSHHEFRLKNVIITNFTIIVIKRKLLIRSNSLIINTVRSCEDPALVDEGGSANVEVLRLLQDGRLNKALVSRSMKMNLIRVINIKRGRKIEGYGTKNSHARTKN